MTAWRNDKSIESDPIDSHSVIPAHAGFQWNMNARWADIRLTGCRNKSGMTAWRNGKSIESDPIDFGYEYYLE